MGVCQWIEIRANIGELSVGEYTNDCYSIKEAFKNGVETLWVDSHPDNNKAITLY